jgi:hypothetical protein
MPQCVSVCVIVCVSMYVAPLVKQTKSTDSELARTYLESLQTA